MGSLSLSVKSIPTVQELECCCEYLWVLKEFNSGFQILGVNGHDSPYLYSLILVAYTINGEILDNIKLMRLAVIMHSGKHQHRADAHYVTKFSVHPRWKERSPTSQSRGVPS